MVDVLVTAAIGNIPENNHLGLDRSICSLGCPNALHLHFPASISSCLRATKEAFAAVMLEPGHLFCMVSTSSEISELPKEVVSPRHQSGILSIIWWSLS